VRALAVELCRRIAKSVVHQNNSGASAQRKAHNEAGG
jgi:hypothetical protein